MDKVIVFDVDDILWDLNYAIMGRLDIDLSKITDFNMSGCPKLTDAERDAVVSEYSKVSSFSNPFYDGVELISDLHNYGFRVKISSNCLTDEIKTHKLNRLASLGVATEDISINLINVDEVKQKAGCGVSVLVDDSPYNVQKSEAELNIMLRKPWNQSDNSKEILDGKNVIFFDTLLEVMHFLQNYQE